MKLFKEHQYLLMRRESRVVIGPKAVNLWLLTAVLTATYFTIAFSAGSTSYLEDKMNDPYTNWVNIDLSGADDYTIASLKAVLDSTHGFGYDNIQTEVNSSLNLVALDGSPKLFSTLFYESLSNDLISAVLSDENVVWNYSIVPDSIGECSYGVIMTIEALNFLGYDIKHLPAYVNYHSKSVGADSIGIVMLSDGLYARAPIPLLAAVKRLPMNKEAVASKYLNEVRIKAGSDCPIDMNHESYARELFFFVPQNVEFTKEEIVQSVPNNLRNYIDDVLVQPQVEDRLRSWKVGGIWRVYTLSGTPLSIIKEIEENIIKKYGINGVERIYNYDKFDVNKYTTRDNVFSVHFTHLDSIGSFEHFVKDISGLQIEMTQVNSRKNFWAVSDMANILTIAMIAFSIISIIIFIVNMLQSYFQKVRRNLGTFKAFGLSTRELTLSYVVIIVCIVITALLISLILTWFTQLLLPVFGLMKDGDYNILQLWNSKTVWAIIIILMATVISVLLVMRHLLRQTPGNLIYDR